MAKTVRIRTKYPGVYSIEAQGADGRAEAIFYIRFRRDGKLIEEKAGRARQDGMTAAKANHLRAKKIEGAATRQEIRNEQKADAERFTVERVWAIYHEQNSANRSAKDDRSQYQNYIRPAFGTKEFTGIVPLDIDRFKRAFLSSKDRRQATISEEARAKGGGKSPASLRNALELLRRLSNFAANKHLCPGLTFKVDMPKVNNEVTESLTDEQMVRLLDVLETFDDRLVADMMLVALVTGMRKSEIFRLKWDDIDDERGFISIKNPKSGVDQVIPLPDQAREIFSRQVEGDHPSPFVFPGRGGKQRQGVKRSVDRIKAEAGLPDDFRGFHGLRHAFASMLASSGEVDMFVLQKLMTHKSAAMTQRYAHLSDQALKRGSSVMDRLVASAKS